MIIFVSRLYVIAKKAGYNVRQVDAMVLDKYSKLNLADLTINEYNSLYHTFWTRVIAIDEVV